tara:strand:+ start:154 stop:834 length:681 start_codon:yes stop_codon:yes gene_type:complete
MIYKYVDKFLMNDFSEIILKILKKDYEKITIFDVGCYQGNFSRALKKNLKIHADFYLFDANPNLTIKDFDYVKLAFSNSEGTKNFYLNTFFPASGSSLNTIHLEDKLWNFTRKLITGNIRKNFKILEVKTDTIDNYCKKNKIDSIEILKIDTEGSEIEVLEGAVEMLDKTNIILVEVLDKRKKFKEKYHNVVKILKKHNFDVALEKNIWSLGTLSNMKAMDILFKK